MSDIPRERTTGSVHRPMDSISSIPQSKFTRHALARALTADDKGRWRSQGARVRPRLVAKP